MTVINDDGIGRYLETSQKIKTIYNSKEDIPVIFPPVKAGNFKISPKVKDYYLVVSRLENYKRVDLVIEAFNLLNLPLIIVGNGSKEKELKSKAKNNIKFYSGVPKDKLENLYSECRAFIFPQYEDFGITALEANASGRPVIAYGAGGVLNTMLPFNGDYKFSTALFFKKQSIPDLVASVIQMEKNYLYFDPIFIRENALRFEEAKFIDKIQRFVLGKAMKGLNKTGN